MSEDCPQRGKIWAMATMSNFELPPGRDDCIALIESNTEPQRPPLCPEIELRLFRLDAPLWRDWGRDLFYSGPRPHWAFCWASGQALARYVLDCPGEVRGRRVVDFGSGCGVAAIAAALSGAAEATAVDSNPLAILAIEMNAVLNHVRVTARLTDPERRDLGEWDVLLAADVCYRTENRDWLFGLTGQQGLVLVADPGRVEFPPEHFVRLRQYDVRTVPEIEHADLSRATVYREE